MNLKKPLDLEQKLKKKEAREKKILQFKQKVSESLKDPDSVRDITLTLSLVLLFIGVCGTAGGFFGACIVDGALLFYLIVKGMGN